MRLYHALTNRPPWGPSDHLTRIDAVLLESGSIPLSDLDVGGFALEDDGDHYTREEYTRFAAQLAHSLRNMRHPLIVSDSTIDWHNHDSNWNRTEWASNVLRRALSDRCVVDVVCGSGFVARAAQNEHFYTRISTHLRTNRDLTEVVILGGWNDEGRTEEACRAIPRLGSLVQRY